MGWQITFNGERRGDEEYFADPDPEKSRWVGGKVVDLGDLSPEAFEKIAADEDDATWWLVFNFPGAKASRYYRVVCLAAQHAGVDAPPKPSTMNEAVVLLELIEKTPDPIEGTSDSTTPSSTGPSQSSDGSRLQLAENE